MTHELARDIIFDAISDRESLIEKILDDYHHDGNLCDDCKRDYEQYTDEIARLKESLAYLLKADNDNESGGRAHV